MIFIQSLERIIWLSHKEGVICVKKYIAIFLCIFMLVLSACRSGENTAPSQGTEPPASATDLNGQSSSTDAESDWSFTSVKENGLSFLSADMLVRFAAMADQDTLCVVANDPTDEETAPLTDGVRTVPLTVYFYDTKRNEATGSFTLAGTELQFFTADGRLYTIDDPGIKTAALRVYDHTGICTQSVDLSADYAGLPAFFDAGILLYSFVSPDGNTLLYNAYAHETNTLEAFVLDLTNGTENRIPLPPNASAKGFDGENILIQKTVDEKTTLSVYSLNGEERKQYSFGKAKSVTGGGQYYAVYDFGKYNGSTVTVLDIKGLKEYEVTLSSAGEGRRFLLSDDGKTLLSYDDAGTFRVYDVKKNQQSASFDIGNIPFAGMMFSCLDADHKTVYLPLGDHGQYELAAFRY